MDVKSTVLKLGHHGGEKATSHDWLEAVAPEYAVISVGKNNAYGHPAESTLTKLKDASIKTYRTDMQGDIVFVSDGHEITVTCEKNAAVDTLAIPAKETASTSEKSNSDSATSTSNSSTGSSATGNADDNSVSDSGNNSGEGGVIAFAPTGDIGNDSSGDRQSPSDDSVGGTQYVTGGGQEYWVNTNTMKFHYGWCTYAQKIKQENLWIANCTRGELIGRGYAPCQKCNP